MSGPTYEYQFLEVFTNRVIRPAVTEKIGLECKFLTFSNPEVADDGKASEVKYDLVFRNQGSHLAKNAEVLTAPEGGIVRAWYRKHVDGNGGGPHVLTIGAFDLKTSTFIPTMQFIEGHSNEGPAVSITLNPPNPTVVVADKKLADIEELGNGVVFRDDRCLIITQTETNFENFVVLDGEATSDAKARTLTVTDASFALALYAVDSRSNTVKYERIEKYKYPTIPWWEWRIAVEKSIDQVFDITTGVIFEHLKTGQLAALDDHLLVEALDGVRKRIRHLEQLGNTLRDLAHKREEKRTLVLG